MGNVSCDKFTRFLDGKDIRYSRRNDSCISIGWDDLKNIKSVAVIISFDEDGKRVELRSYSVGSFKDELFTKGLIACNEVNKKYRWVKFYLDDDQDVVATDDAVIDSRTSDDECFELMIRMMSIIDESYPTFMRARFS